MHAFDRHAMHALLHQEHNWGCLSLALEFFLALETSKPIMSEEGEKLGVIDAVIPSTELLIVARQWALDIAESRKPWMRSLHRTDEIGSISEACEVLKLGRQQVKRTARNMPQHLACLDVIEEGIVDGGYNGLVKEAKVLQDSNIRGLVARKKLQQDKANKAFSMLKGVLDYSEFKDVDMVIEAVIENVPLKQQIFTDIEKFCPPLCILASNTSTNIIGQKTRSQDRIIGAHFFRLQDLADGIVVRAADLDVASVLGMNFPSYRGGIVFWADTVGAGHIYKSLCKWSELYGNFFKPSKFLEERAAKGIPLSAPASTSSASRSPT